MDFILFLSLSIVCVCVCGRERERERERERLCFTITNLGQQLLTDQNITIIITVQQGEACLH